MYKSVLTQLLLNHAYNTQRGSSSVPESIQPNLVLQELKGKILSLYQKLCLCWKLVIPALFTVMHGYLLHLILGNLSSIHAKRLRTLICTGPKFSLKLFRMPLYLSSHSFWEWKFSHEEVTRKNEQPKSNKSITFSPIGGFRDRGMFIESAVSSWLLVRKSLHADLHLSASGSR